MEWWWLILTAMALYFSINIFRYGLQINKGTHEKKSIFDYAKNAPALSLSFSIFGFIIEIIFSLTFGVIMRYSPWWLAKILIFLIASVLFYLGVLAIMKML